MNELAINMKKKYPTFYITPQHLGQVIRDNNKTRKRTRHESRSKNLSTGLDEPVKPKFTRSAKGKPF